MRLAFLAILAALAAAAPAAACGDGDSDGPDDGRLRVVATTAVLGAIAMEVGGDRIQLTVLVTAGTDPHDFELRSGHRRAVDRADVLLRHGLGLDAFLDRTVKPSDERVTTVTDGVRLRDVGGEPDPHVWHDADNATTMTENVAGALSRRDPAGAAAFADAAARYAARLKGVDSEIRALFASIDPSRRVVVTNHDSLGYFLDRYGIVSVGSVIPGLSSSAEPSARDVAALVDVIRREGVTAILAESSVSPVVARRIAADTGVPIVDDLYGDTLGGPGSGAETLDGMLRVNAMRIAAAIEKPRAP